MAIWLKRRPSGCREAEKGIREQSNSTTAETLEAWLAAADPSLRGHVAGCSSCRAEVEGTLAIRQLLRREVPPMKDPGPAFTARVMRAIAAQQAQRAPATNPWYAVPALAARVVWVSAVALLLATTWVYEKRSPAVEQRTSVESAGASLEPAPPPANQDEVLASLAGREP
jgi:hypothetical protein